MSARAHLDSDDGFSLPEVLITIVIVGVTFAAILGGLMTTISVSALHKKEATADAAARSAAEWIKDSTHQYVSCASPTTYPMTDSDLSVPPGFHARVTNVEYWNGAAPVTGSPYLLTFTTSCPTNPDKGLQRITVRASSADGQVIEEVQVVKRSVP